MDTPSLLQEAAARLDALAARSTAGDWRPGGLLASRPEVIAHRPDGSTEHVAEARASSAAWIVALSPAIAGPLADWLRAAATDPEAGQARAVAELLVERLPPPAVSERL